MDNHLQSPVTDQAPPMVPWVTVHSRPELRPPDGYSLEAAAALQPPAECPTALRDLLAGIVQRVTKP